MPKPEPRYHVRFKGLSITKFDPETGLESTFQGVDGIDWGNMKYRHVVQFQSALNQLMDQLNEFGVDEAKRKEGRSGE